MLFLGWYKVTNNILRTIPVMNIEVDYGDSFNTTTSYTSSFTPYSSSIGRSYCNIVYEAETSATVLLFSTLYNASVTRMVSWRPHHAKGITVRSTANSVDSMAYTTRCTHGCFKGLSTYGSITVKILDRSIFSDGLARSLYAFDIGEVVHSYDIAHVSTGGFLAPLGTSHKFT